MHTTNDNVELYNDRYYVKRLLYCQTMQVTNLGRRRTWEAEQYQCLIVEKCRGKDLLDLFAQ